MQSWYQDLPEDRLTHCGHSLDAVFHLTADRSNPLVALKRSTQNREPIGDRPIMLCSKSVRVRVIRPPSLRTWRERSAPSRLSRNWPGPPRKHSETSRMTM